jgi:PAS domain S-box-containing protein
MQLLHELREALRESEARIRRAISVPNVGILFFDLAGHMREANNAFQKMCGYTIEELRATMHWERLTAPEFREVTKERARDLAERGETPPYEKAMIRKDGTRWWGLFSPTRLSNDWINSQCVEFALDIT